MNSSVHVDNKGKDISILGKGPSQGLGEHLLTAEKMYSVNFTDHINKDIFIRIWWKKIILHKMFLTELTVLSSLTNTTR